MQHLTQGSVVEVTSNLHLLCGEDHSVPPGYPRTVNYKLSWEVAFLVLQEVVKLCHPSSLRSPVHLTVRIVMLISPCAQVQFQQEA